jgi:acetoin utilization deacetylase AcuC-like enzyme
VRPLVPWRRSPAARAPESATPPQLTLVTFHPATRLHQAWAGHPERPQRIEAVLEALRDPALASIVSWIQAAPADRTTLQRVHPARHLDALEAMAAAGGGAIDPDTHLGPRSWDAIVASAGTAVRAVTEVLSGGTAFAATRPPGHHALAERAMGFCFVNNAVVAARHAQALGAARVLIVDWDVHHGNGTQALVESDASIRYVSLHQFPWYPGTGAASERGVGNVFNVPRPPGLPRFRYVQDLLTAVDSACVGWTPDVLIISAGFDSLAGDPLGGFPLEPDDITTWTTELRSRLPACPVVAVLEGGYRIDLLTAGVTALVSALA